mgnify:CR=1 FL=1|jgi:hypothetical protein
MSATHFPFVKVKPNWQAEQTPREQVEQGALHIYKQVICPAAFYPNL